MYHHLTSRVAVLLNEMFASFTKSGRVLKPKFGACMFGCRNYHVYRPHNKYVYNNVSETIGETPVVRLNKLAPENVEIFVKIESFNPMSSVKDRLALAIILDAERRGLLKKGDTVVESTSGNTGISLAMVCAQRGYKFVTTMTETFSLERRRTMRALGARVVLTPAAAGGVGMVMKARELSEKYGWFLTRQFENIANPLYHSRTTAPEILLAFKDSQLDYFVSGYGTGGTFAGVSKVLKAADTNIKCVLCEPELAPLVSSGVQQQRNHDGSPSAPHEKWTPHPIQGWTPNFIPSVLDYSIENVDKIVTINAEEAKRTARLLATQEGVYTGMSGGATVNGALQMASSCPRGSTLLAILPDTMDRYLSTALLSDIQDDMNEEEMQLSQATPAAQF